MSIHIKTDIDIQKFLNQVHKCGSEVTYETPEGDHIALRSTLSQCMFYSIAADPERLRKGTLRIQKEEDRALLEEFLDFSRQ